MSDYIDIADCEARIDGSRLRRLYGLETADPLASSTDITEDILTAEAFVNSYVGKRYSVPVTEGDAVRLLMGWSLDLFAELAYMRGAGDDIPEKIKRRADRARKDLEMVAKGGMTLAGATSVPESNAAGGSSILVSGNDAQFKRDDLNGF